MIIALTVAYMPAASVTTVFASVAALAGLLAAVFYIMTSVAAGVLPLPAAAFLGWVLAESVQSAPAAEV